MGANCKARVGLAGAVWALIRENYDIANHDFGPGVVEVGELDDDLGQGRGLNPRELKQQIFFVVADPAINSRHLLCYQLNRKIKSKKHQLISNVSLAIKIIQIFDHHKQTEAEKLFLINCLKLTLQVGFVPSAKGLQKSELR